MNVQIFIPSFRRDIEYLSYCLRSLQKFSTSFAAIVVDVPREDVPMFRTLCEAHGAILKSHTGETKENGHLVQQIVKMHADELCKGADYVLFLDSDCVVTEPITPLDYLIPNDEFEHMPVLCHKPWTKSRKDEVKCWRAVTERALGIKCPQNTMVRHPAVHYVGILEAVRKHVSELHGMSFDSYVLAQQSDPPGSFPPRFSEFNCIGSFALEFYPERYHWIDVSKEEEPKAKIRQAWSHQEPTEVDKEVYRSIGILE